MLKLFFEKTWFEHIENLRKKQMTLEKSGNCYIFPEKNIIVSVTYKIFNMNDFYQVVFQNFVRVVSQFFFLVVFF